LELILLFKIYLAFAFATGITAMFSLYRPVLQRIEEDKKTLEFKTLTSVTFLCIATLLAPHMFLLLFSEHGSEVFKDSLYESLSKSQT
jgi:O-antigen/teichoic acid export membrane protein